MLPLAEEKSLGSSSSQIMFSSPSGRRRPHRRFAGALLLLVSTRHTCADTTTSRHFRGAQLEEDAEDEFPDAELPEETLRAVASSASSSGADSPSSSWRASIVQGLSSGAAVLEESGRALFLGEGAHFGATRQESFEEGSRRNPAGVTTTSKRFRGADPTSFLDEPSSFLDEEKELLSDATAGVSSVNLLEADISEDDHMDILFPPADFPPTTTASSALDVETPPCPDACLKCQAGDPSQGGKPIYGLDFFTP